jgi:excisionase family DNA binding protein
MPPVSFVEDRFALVTYYRQRLKSSATAPTAGAEVASEAEAAPTFLAGWQAALVMEPEAPIPALPLPPREAPKPINGKPRAPPTPPLRGRGRPRGTPNKATSPAPPKVLDPTIMAVRIPEAARRLSLSATMVKELVTTGRLKSLKVGAVRLIAVKEIAAFLERSG